MARRWRGVRRVHAIEQISRRRRRGRRDDFDAGPHGSNISMEVPQRREDDDEVDHITTSFHIDGVGLRPRRAVAPVVRVVEV